MEATLLVRCWSVFDQVASLSPDVREGRVAELCDGDRALEAEVRALLKAGDSSAFATAPVQDALARGPLGSPAPAGDSFGRYEDLGLLGRGAMGEVRRVRDSDLSRTLAMKICHPELVHNPAALARFVEEAQCGAQLQHPGIVPVHDAGRLPDGRVYFTMSEVRGRTLTEVIDEVHAASAAERWEAGPSGWSFRRLVDAFGRLCQAVAHAHERGVVHRDLKPGNVMIGDRGSVLVVDWGLAKILGRRDWAAETGQLAPVITDRSKDGAMATRTGVVAGTPAYMPPEQAAGEVDRIEARSDVYALGAVLYYLLSGRPPYTGTSALEVLEKVRNGRPRPAGRRALLSVVASLGPGGFEPDLEDSAPPGLPLPPELVRICERAMSREPVDRHPNAGALAEEVAAWLEGLKTRETALEIVSTATARGPEAEALRDRAAALKIEAADLLASVESWQPAADKVAGWALQDEAAELDRRARLAEWERSELLNGALMHVPDLVEAHEALAEHLQVAHAAAEAASDAEDTSRLEALLRRHAFALPRDHAVRARCASWLRGTGALSLVTDPPGAEVLLYRYVVRDRRLVPEFEKSLGLTPLLKVPLAMGSYLCVLRHPERAEVRYPISVARQEHWHGVPPGGADPFPIRLPLPGELGPDDCYVPAGTFACGGDDLTEGSLPAGRPWVDAVVCQRFQVTNRDYIGFLDRLVADGREQEALEHVPRSQERRVDAGGSGLYGRDDDGRFILVPDPEGDLWDPEWPVFMIDWFGARAYAQMAAADSGLPWRLPMDLEWEKAARGVDGRAYPWGDRFDASRCCSKESHEGPRLPKAIDSFPDDESVYGVRGTAGNVRDWIADILDHDNQLLARDYATVQPPAEGGGDTFRWQRGGAWFGAGGHYCRSAYRASTHPIRRLDNLGFRLVRSL